jgi:trigger factor
MKDENNNEDLSLSKQRKLAKKKEFARRKRNAVLTKIIVTLLILAVIGIVVLVIVKDQIKKAKSVAVDTDYSAQLDDNGKIKGIKAADYVSIPDYNNITADLSEIEYSDESVEKDIDTLLNNKKYLDSSADLIAANGDKVNIDYKGSVDGVEFDGGTAEGADLELGSKSFIDDFEQQIEGHKPGDEFNVEVTFPEDYTNDPGLAGKDAVFAVKLNGIYVKPEFNDAFVQENLSEHA